MVHERRSEDLAAGYRSAAAAITRMLA